MIFSDPGSIPGISINNTSAFFRKFMKKHYIIIGIAGAILLVAGFMYFLLGGASRGVQKVVSDDGLAELEIPKNALPEGVSIKDITMTAIAPADFFKESNQPIDSVKIYRLEPDGFTLSKPATISVTLSYNPNRAYSPIFLTYSGEKEEAENLNVTDFQIDEERKTFTVSGELSHFSELIFNAEARIFNERHIPEGDITLPVGQSFDHTYILTASGKWEFVTKDRNDPTLEYHHTFEIGNGTRWVMNPNWRSPHFISAGWRLEPEKIILKEVDLGATEEYRTTNRFTCVRVGHGSPGLSAWPYYTLQETQTVFRDGKQIRKTWVGRERHYARLHGYGPNIDCVASPSGQESPSADVRTGEESSPATIAPPSAAPKPSGGTIKVCGLPGGPACPKR
ncbi:MAG: hypothetical protein UW81_C0005G0027 [Candidatus Giovannonibacteria bacterium GW2011_GWC2_44_9]|uniref:Uncharacterized protein n=3 Tax=Candidatus Giovannoniibacteriota TaxID=1752738 RepID=A0A0G1LWF0_9BACT|nr:MAG: hypothetical protein UW49_C0007G0070 [Candidatus Giovannonibacteria bacterium GW2011_GWB1_44_23]KKT64074.1 MAG: hypothetical protein UW57_C0003G0068 [Candidatus Giovannonibacteria bacterium GW2011_GWA1_44_29]KKT84198.1 MAG: hypothetical protein UW81_C0005G0027 [Candidatus Giovannonibacteria bacterium GW2011_GWC2_44_9]KKT91922.1 MAG: hypothetical protein UW93_C0002G0069 [Parcubacteria group bacterium GW2011_GWC1_45_13]